MFSEIGFYGLASPAKTSSTLAVIAWICSSLRAISFALDGTGFAGIAGQARSQAAQFSVRQRSLEGLGGLVQGVR